MDEGKTRDGWYVTARSHGSTPRGDPHYISLPYGAPKPGSRIFRTSTDVGECRRVTNRAGPFRDCEGSLLHKGPDLFAQDMIKSVRHRGHGGHGRWRAQHERRQ